MFKEAYNSLSFPTETNQDTGYDFNHCVLWFSNKSEQHFGDNVFNNEVNKDCHKTLCDEH